MKHSEETKRKLKEKRKLQIKKPHSKESKNKIRQSILEHNQNHPERYSNPGFLNHHHSEETKRKISQSVLKLVGQDKSKFTRRKKFKHSEE